MKELNNYILEKLHIKKGMKIGMSKNELIFEISYQVKHCLEDDYNISMNKYDINLIDDKKCITQNNNDTWYVEVEFYTNDERKVNAIKASIMIRLKDTIDKNNIQCYKIDDGKYIYKIFLYDPE